MYPIPTHVTAFVDALVLVAIAGCLLGLLTVLLAWS
jgi:hypothetical protein